LEIHNQTSNQAVIPTQAGGCANLATLGFVFAWIAVVNGGYLLTGITLTALLDQLGVRVPFTMALARIGILGLVLLPLSSFNHHPLYRPAFRTASLGLLFSLLASLIFLTPPYAAQLHAVLHISAAVVYTLIIWFFAGRSHPLRSGEASSQRFLFLPALIGALIFAFPWLAWGAFGSPWDILLQALAALAVGLAAAITLELFLFPSLLDGAPYLSPASRFGLVGITIFMLVSILMGGWVLATT
jgi:hypothetical protein